MKRYYEYTEVERAALDGEAFYDAVKREAITRGIKPPVPFSERLKTVGFAGYRVPADAVKFYEIVMPQRYGGGKPTGLAYRTEEEAQRALHGAVGLSEEGYGATARTVIAAGEWGVRHTYVSLAGAKDYTAAITESDDDCSTEAFDTLADECRDDAQRIRQEAYNKQVRAEKRVEYLRLAGGNAEIATAFWTKVETGSFPQEDGS